MNLAIQQFLDAHERYQALEQVRTGCSSPEQREQMHIALLRAYLEVQNCARLITGLQGPDAMRFAKVN
jgi:hypothetical protein